MVKQGSCSHEQARFVCHSRMLHLAYEEEAAELIDRIKVPTLLISSSQGSVYPSTILKAATAGTPLMVHWSMAHLGPCPPSAGCELDYIMRLDLDWWLSAPIVSPNYCSAHYPHLSTGLTPPKILRVPRTTHLRSTFHSPSDRETSSSS